METINSIELRDESIYPDETVLQALLGESYPSYALLLELYRTHGMNSEWRYYRDGKAWLCKVQHKKRTIVWMSAWRGYMQATVYLPEKHMDKLQSLDIEESTRNRILTAKKVGKSTPCIFEIRNTAVLKDFERLMHFKIQWK